MKFPEEAEPVRKYIRDNVKRPRELPTFATYSTRLRWGEYNGVCPLGLCPNSGKPAPSYINDFSVVPPFTQEELWSFIEFWDSQQFPQYAVDAVWGNAKTP